MAKLSVDLVCAENKGGRETASTYIRAGQSVRRNWLACCPPALKNSSSVNALLGIVLMS